MNRVSRVAMLLGGALTFGSLTMHAPVSAQQPVRTGGLAISLHLSKPLYRVGEPVVIRLVLANETAAAMIVQFPAGRQYDLSISSASQRIWTLARPQMEFEQRMVIAARQTVAFEEVWNQRSDQGRPVEPGVYILSARVTASISGEAALQFSGVQPRPTVGQRSLGEPPVRSIDVAPVRFTIRR